MPFLRSYLPDDVDYDDENYIVRIDNITHRFEIGYPDDEWYIK